MPGLATSVYAASEGLSVLVLDCRSSGGQAGASARIENYLGVPTGISGMALMARAYNQAHKFGVEITIPSEVVGLDTPDANKPGRFVLRLASGDHDRERPEACRARLAWRSQRPRTQRRRRCRQELDGAFCLLLERVSLEPSYEVLGGTSEQDPLVVTRKDA